MTSRRTLLRQAFVAHLRFAIPSLDQRVYSSRLMPIEEPELPAILVHTREKEQIIERSKSGWSGYEKRRGIVSVVCVAQSFQDPDEQLGSDIDTELDTMADQVEAALQSWTIPGFESSDPELLDSDASDPEFDGSLATGARILRYAVNYTTPYRDCSNPYVQPDTDDIMRSGAYPGGQVTAGCPAANTGQACPIGTAELFSQEEPIN